MASGGQEDGRPSAGSGLEWDKVKDNRCEAFYNITGKIPLPLALPNATAPFPMHLEGGWH